MCIRDSCIIDEVDYVLIDEARTPLIISGQSGKSTKLYEVCDVLARQLERGTVSKELSKIDAIMGEEIEETGDFVVDEKDKVVNLTEQGVKKVEEYFHIDNLADPENLEIQHNIILAPVSYTHLISKQVRKVLLLLLAFSQQEMQEPRNYGRSLQRRRMELMQ